ncbi:MAG: hypothetical protein JSR87_14525 [Proteobacteria bacterium]|nr:hypothetical protein [Pseudomonadota bacterium]MBS0571805.1 hypothetical protein [Pseudomonadota bacterium]
MSDRTPSTQPRVPVFVRILNLFRDTPPVPESERHLDRKTRHAIRGLPAHLRRDIGLID